MKTEVLDQIRYLDWRSGDLPSCDVFDADGVQHKSLFTLDRKTGEYEQIDRDDEGKALLEGDEIKTVEGKMPTPIRIEWHGQNT